MPSNIIPRRPVSPLTRPNGASVTRQALAVLGGSEIGYVKAARSEDVAFMCPDAPVLAPGQPVFVLYAADGTPLLVTDTREAALASAANEQLETLSLH